MDFFQDHAPIKEKKEKISKLVNTMIDDKGLFMKFKNKSMTTKEDKRLNHKVLDPLQFVQVNNIE